MPTSRSTIAIIALAILAALLSAAPAPAGTTDATSADIDRARWIRVALAEGDTVWLNALNPSANEIADAQLALRIREQATPISLSAALGADNFAGLYRDALTGRAVILTTGDISDARSAVLFIEGDPTVLPAKYTYEQINEWYDLLVERLPERVSVGLYVKQNKLGIGIDDPARLDTSGIPADALFYETYKEGIVAMASDQADHHDAAVTIPGIAIELTPEGEPREESACTWGFTAYDTTSANRAFAVTAGHCSPDGWVDNTTVQVDLWQTSTNDDVPCTDCTSTQRLDNRGMYVRRVGHADVARIRGNTFADTNCTHTLSHNCTATITSVRDKDLDAPGDDVCVSLPMQDQPGGGHEDVYVCGEIQDPVRNTIDYFHPVYGWHRLTNAREVDIVSGGGNSGAGFKFGQTLYGILVAGQIGQPVTFFGTAEDAEEKLGANVAICTFDGCK